MLVGQLHHSANQDLGASTPAGDTRVDAGGAVETTVYASRIGSDYGYGVPSAAVRHALESAHGPISTGRCLG